MSAYEIISGRYETGTPLQQQAFRELFGTEDTRAKFELYFHWYNILHEFAHCLSAMRKVWRQPVEEEQYANDFAVQYWRLADGADRLKDFRRLIDTTYTRLPQILPDGVDFQTYFSDIWSSERMGTVEVYGYFQICCVRRAFDRQARFGDLLGQIGIQTAREPALEWYTIENISAPEVLTLAQRNLRSLGVDGLEICLRLVDDPETQCCRKV